MHPRPGPSRLPRNTLRNLVLGAAASAGTLAPAATLTWQNNATSSTWSLAGNWGGTAPSDGDDLVFSSASGSLAFNPTNNDLVDLRLRSLTFLGGTFNSALTLGGERLILDGTLGATSTLSTTNTSAGRTVTIGNRLELVGTQTWTTADDFDSRITITGSVSGDGALLLSGRDDESVLSLTSRAASINFTPGSGHDNSAYLGNVTISTQVAFNGSSAAYFSGAAEVRVTAIGQITFNYALTTAELANLRLETGSDLIISGTGGSVGSVDLSTVLADTGATLLLNNYAGVASNRLGGAGTSVHLDDFALHLHGSSSTNSAESYTETIGALTYEGATTLQVRSRSSTSSKIALAADSLSLAAGKTGTLSVIIEFWDDANGLFLTNSPTVTHGILSPGIIASNTRDFTTVRNVTSGAFAGQFQVAAFTAYTDYLNPGVWTPGSTTEVSRLFFDDSSAGLATLAADVETFALKIDNSGAPSTRGIDLAGHRLTIGSGGLILARNENEDIELRGSVAGSELAFGSQTAYIYTHGASNSTSGIFAPISGTGGLVKHGVGGLELTGTNTLTGGIHINEGALFLGTNDSLNNNVLTLGPSGVLNIRSTPTTNILAGLNGLGEVRIASGHGDQTLRIHTADGETHTSSAVLYNVGGTLSLEKTGAGTQIFTGNRAATSVGGTSTGVTEVYEGTLVVDGDWSATTGDFNAYFGTTLSGGGAIGGPACVEGTLAPGYQSTRGDLRFLGNLTLTNDTSVELNLDGGATRGATYDSFSVGGLLSLDGTLFLNLTSAAAAATQTYQIYDFGSLAGQFDQVSITGAFSTQLTRFDEVWTGESGGHSFSFDSSIGQVVIAPVPVPATFAALAGFGALGYACFRRRPRA